MEMKALVEIPSHTPSNFNEWSQLLPKARFWVPSNLDQRWWRSSHCGQAVRAWRLPTPPTGNTEGGGKEEVFWALTECWAWSFLSSLPTHAYVP